MSTGEGKSVVIALLAAMLVLKGEKVVILVREKTLRDRDHDFFKPFFEQLAQHMDLECGVTVKNDFDPAAHVSFVIQSDISSAYIKSLLAGQVVNLSELILIVDEGMIEMSLCLHVFEFTSICQWTPYWTSGALICK